MKVTYTSSVVFCFLPFEGPSFFFLVVWSYFCSDVIFRRQAEFFRIFLSNNFEHLGGTSFVFFCLPHPTDTVPRFLSETIPYISARTFLQFLAVWPIRRKTAQAPKTLVGQMPLNYHSFLELCGIVKLRASAFRLFFLGHR